MTRVVHMTSAHPPFDVRIFHKECKTLAAAGYDVALIAPGEADLVKDGIPIYSVPKQGNRIRRMTGTVRGVYRAARRLDADIYHFHDPELIPVGLALRACGKRVIYDVHEEYERDILNKDYIPKPLRLATALAFGALQSSAAPFFDGIIATRPALVERFRRNAGKVALVNNFPILGELAAVEPIPFPCRPALGAYVGGLWRQRGAVEMSEAMACLPAGFPLELAVMGEVSPPDLAERLASMSGASRIRYMGFQTRPQVSDVLGHSLFGVVLFHAVGNHLNSYPTKVFEYMSAGLPVIASNIPLWREIIEAPGCGILVDPLKPESVASAMMYLAEHRDEAAAMGRRGLEAVTTQFNWSNEAARLLDLYSRISDRKKYVRNSGLS